MLELLKKYKSGIISVLVMISVLAYLYGCEPKVRSLEREDKLINRQELQLELDTIIAKAQLRVLDLDKQEQIRAIILQNALVLVQGQPLNIFGLLSGLAAIYGVTQAGGKVTKTVKNIAVKRKVENGTA